MYVNPSSQRRPRSEIKTYGMPGYRNWHNIVPSNWSISMKVVSIQNLENGSMATDLRATEFMQKYPAQRPRTSVSFPLSQLMDISRVVFLRVLSMRIRITPLSKTEFCHCALHSQGLALFSLWTMQKYIRTRFVTTYFCANN